jgi:hypothetical protein
MSAPLAAVAPSEAQRWQDWLDRGVAGERRRTARMKGLLAILIVALSIVFGALL